MSHSSLVNVFIIILLLSVLVYRASSFGPVFLGRIPFEVCDMVVSGMPVLMADFHFLILLVVRLYDVVEPYVYDSVKRNSYRSLMRNAQADLVVSAFFDYAFLMGRGVGHRGLVNPSLEFVAVLPYLKRLIMLAEFLKSLCGDVFGRYSVQHHVDPYALKPVFGERLVALVSLWFLSHLILLEFYRLHCLYLI